MIRQLWEPLLLSDDYRVSLNPSPDPDWQARSTFWVVPSAHRPALLVSGGPRRGVMRALTKYSGLRAPQARLGRRVLAMAAYSRVPLASDTLTLETRRGARDSELDPLSRMEQVLGCSLLMITGVRTGANAKATLQLFTLDGDPAGYAKVGWNKVTNQMIDNEVRTLNALAGRKGALVTPDVLAAGTVGERSFLLTEPLPPDVRILRGPQDLRASDFAAVAPQVRRDTICTSQQFQDVTSRLASYSDNILASHRDHALALANSIAANPLPLPIGECWHGDLVPWNGARRRDGTLCLWDWEMTEEDAAIGLDVLHWILNTSRDSSPQALPDNLLTAAATERDYTAALGLGARQRCLVAAVYALSLVDRQLRLAAEHQGWSTHRLQPDTLTRLLEAGQVLVTRSERR